MSSVKVEKAEFGFNGPKLGNPNPFQRIHQKKNFSKRATISTVQFAKLPSFVKSPFCPLSKSLHPLPFPSNFFLASPCHTTPTFVQIHNCHVMPMLHAITVHTPPSPNPKPLPHASLACHHHCHPLALWCTSMLSSITIVHTCCHDLRRTDHLAPAEIHTTPCHQEPLRSFGGVKIGDDVEEGYHSQQNYFFV